MNIIANKPKYTSGSEISTDQPLFVLIDYENVQTEDLSYLNQPHMHVLLFVGALQKKISTKLAVQMQALGSRAQYIQLEATGQNALDMCIAHHTGFILARMPTARFFIISKDKGYDPLIQFLNNRGVPIERSPQLPSSLPPQGERSAQQTTPHKHAIERIIEILKRHDKNRPASRATLISWTTNKISSEKLGLTAEKIIKDFEKRGNFLRWKTGNLFIALGLLGN